MNGAPEDRDRVVVAVRIHPRSELVRTAVDGGVKMVTVAAAAESSVGVVAVVVQHHLSDVVDVHQDMNM